MGKTRQRSLLEHDRSDGIRLTEQRSLVCESVDLANGIIRGVKIIGLESRNGRRYLTEALQRALPLYENVRVNLNHPANPSAPRDYRDRIGFLKNVTFAADGLRGDLCFNPKHPLAEQIAWDAENAPRNLGLSHNAVGQTTTDRAGETVVNEITRLHSVDLVADPATTKSLFESEGNVADEMKPEDEEVTPVVEMDGEEEKPVVEEEPMVSEPSLDQMAEAFFAKLKLHAIDAAGDDGTAVGAAIEKIKEVKAILAELMGGATADAAVEESIPANGGKPAKSAVDPDRAKMKAELKALREQVEAANRKESAREARIAKKTLVVEAIKSAKLDEKHVSKTFMESLMAAPDVRVKALIEDRAAFVRSSNGQSPRSAPAGNGGSLPYKSTQEAVNSWRSN